MRLAMPCYVICFQTKHAFKPLLRGLGTWERCSAYGAFTSERLQDSDPIMQRQRPPSLCT